MDNGTPSGDGAVVRVTIARLTEMGGAVMATDSGFIHFDRADKIAPLPVGDDLDHTISTAMHELTGRGFVFHSYDDGDFVFAAHEADAYPVVLAVGS